MRPFKLGTTFDKSGKLTLPPSNYAAVATLTDSRRNPPVQGSFGLTVTVTDLGVNAADASLHDYLFHFRAEKADTANWPTPIRYGEILNLGLDVILTDGSGNSVDVDPAIVRVRS